MKVFNIILWFGICFRLINADEDVFHGGVQFRSINLIHGKHLRVIWPNWEGNPPGLTGPFRGKLMIEYLSARFHFTYEFVRITENWLDPINQTIKGQFNYLWDDEADLLLCQIVPFSGRQYLIDMTFPFNYDYFALLIPVSDSKSTNTSAVVKPFQWPVWLSLFISTVLVIYVLKMIQKFLLVISKFKSKPEQNKDRAELKFTNPFVYVLANLLNQGEAHITNRFAIRLVAGAWCLAAFVFVQAYNTTLITYVLAPTNYPMVNSFRELVEKTEIDFWIRKAGPMERLLYSTENPDPFLIKLGVKKASTPTSKCLAASDCVSQVKQGLKNVYGDAVTNLRNYVKQRFLKTGQCELEIIGNDLLTITTSLGLKRNSPYTSFISRGLTLLFFSTIIW